MKLSRSFLILAAIALGALGLVLYSRSQQVDFAENDRFERLLAELGIHDSLLNQNLLKVRYRLIGDYDALGAEIATLKQTVADLGTVPSFLTPPERTTIAGRVEDFSRLLAIKEQALEKFKSENAVLNNSLRYLPHAGAELLSRLAADGENRAIEASVARLLQQVLIYCLQPGEEEAPAIRTAIEGLSRWRADHPAHVDAPAIGRFAAHAGSIIARKPKVEALTDQAIALPTSGAVVELSQRYEMQLTGALRRSEVLRAGLEVLCALLLPTIGYTIYALAAGKRNLERRVVERTAELSQENAQRQRAEEELRSASRFLQTTLDALSSHIAILNRDGVIVSVNAAWQKFAEANGALLESFGTGANYLRICEAAVGDCAAEAVAVAAGIRRVMSGEKSEFSLEYPCHSSTEQRWFLVRVTCFGSGEALHMVVAHENVTARALAEQHARKQEAELRTLFDLIPAMICFKDTENRILRVNRPLAEAAGKSVEDFVGRRTEEIFPDDAARYFAEDLAVIRSGQPQASVLEKRLGADGEEHWFQTERVPHFDETGTVAGVVIHVQEVTARKRSEMEMEQLHRRLLETSRQAGMAEVATGVLHNVGNVLNSVNVSATLVADSAKKSKVGNLVRVVALLDGHAADLGDFLSTDPQGRNLPAYLRELSERLVQEQTAMVREVESLRQNIEHIKEIVAMQQDYAKVSGITEVLSVAELVEDSLRLNSAALVRHEVTVERDFHDVPPIVVEKHKALQILVNLIRNAKHACDGLEDVEKRVTIRVANGQGRIKIIVADNGVGIPPENLTRIFNHGFTTRKHGHGFGLHSGALAARDLGGSLSAQSDGVGRGATFTLELPATAASS